MALLACNNREKGTDKGAIFLSEFDTPYGAPPFDKISVEDYVPAFEAGMAQQEKEIDAIVNNPDAPTFENTMLALDNSGSILERVSSVFYGLEGTDTNEKMQQIKEEMSPKLTAHSDNISLNEKLFERIKTLYDNAASLDLTPEQFRLLEVNYKNFVRSGIMLDKAGKERLREINKQLSALTIQFNNNVLTETNNYKLVIDNEADLAGLPQSVVNAAAEAATAAGEEGKWVFTLHKPSWIPFLQYADNRDLREKLYKAMYMRGNHDNEYDNKALISEIVNLRLERSNLLGYKDFAAYALEERMAKNEENVYKLLNDVWKYALPQAKKEAAELQSIIDREGGKFKLASWDWWYYTEKLRQEKFALNEEELRPYFKMENVREGVFMVANKLYGLNFSKLDNIPIYHPEVEVYEVTDADGSHLSLFYTDYFPRAGKRAGAWMSNFREQTTLNGEEIRPIVYNVGNFTKPLADTPSLLSLDDVETLFHEFGHALHGMLSQVTYHGLSGTNVARDFVELPSQIMEHWALKPEVLKMYAKHYETGEVIPDALIEKIEAAGKFNMGFTTTELVAAALLDMDYHTQTKQQAYDVNAFEKTSMNKIGLIDEIIPRYKSTYYSHIFSSAEGYASGYYSYLWSEVLDADAFQAFAEKGIFDQETARLFRNNVLSKGNTADPMELYKKFRGAEPDPVYLLKNRGFIE
ncbi:MAG: M3 family metallopeptidase [Proteiniphilum sp.]|nr:M3 family metallopeptidase [Proteiniphilum sp.]MDD4799812.1 M3 family metallopeptidase [Proteiniphilum sp.]